MAWWNISKGDQYLKEKDRQYKMEQYKKKTEYLKVKTAYKKQKAELKKYSPNVFKMIGSIRTPKVSRSAKRGTINRGAFGR